MHGLGGIGKTRAAIEYARRHHGEYSALLMVRADSGKAFRTNLANLALPGVLNLPEQKDPEEDNRFDAVLRWLGSHPRWLLIIDNTDTEEAAAAVEDLLGRFDSGHVLITSRLDAWSPQVRGFDLRTLTEEDAVSFLLERTAVRRRRKASDAEDAASLAARLDGLALALEQAGAYIAERRISFERYLDLFDARREEVLTWYDPRLMRYPTSVAATWLTSFGQLGAAARDLLDSLSFLAPDPIPCSMIEKAGDGPELGEALAELYRYSLVRFLNEPPDTFSVHRLVQEIIRSQLGYTAREAWGRAADLLLHEVPKDSEDPSTWNAWRRLAPHCKAMIAGTEAQECTASVVHLMSHYAGFLIHGNAEYTAAEPLLRRALETRERVLGPEHPDTLASLNNLAELLRTKGDHTAAEALHRRTLEASERVLGAEHPSTLASLNNLAELLRAKGDHTAAEALHRRTLEASEQVLGPEHPITLNSLTNLAFLFNAKGDHAAAEEHHRRALEGKERVLGPEHPSTLTSLNNLAALLYAQGNYLAAEPLLRKALETRERVMGSEHPGTLASLNNLAALLNTKGEYDAAEPLFRRTLEARERVLGPEHYDTLSSLNNLAALLNAKGNHVAAEALYRRTLETRERVLGPEHPSTLNSLNNLAALLDTKTGEPLHRRALEARERVLGLEHPDTLISLSNLAALLYTQGNYLEAEPLLRRALETRERVLGADHPDTLNSRNNLVKLLKSKNASGEN